MTVVVLALIAALVRTPSWSGLRAYAAALGVVLAVQLSLGVANVVLQLPLAVATAHNAGGAALLLTIVALHCRLPSAGREPGR